MKLVFPGLVILLKSLICPAWVEWDYSSSTTNEWEDIWGYDEGPRLRRGHSLVIHHDMNRIFLFGGRGTQILRAHNPKTYEVIEVNGTLEFLTYDQNPVNECNEETSNSSSSPYSFTGTSTENGNCSNYVTVGLYYNDVWEYDLDCERYGDGPCEDRGWKVMHAGATHGGCSYYLGREICDVPYERWYHSAAMFNDSTMLIYGGYSHRCEDYCDDMWSFDLRDNTWTEIYSLGDLSGDSSSVPGKRWRFSALSNGEYMWVFGGHRLWHGFATDNSASNDWSSYDQYPEGGYLNDFWVYRKTLLGANEQVPLDSSNYGNWTRIMPQKLEFVDELGEPYCEFSDWPSERAAYAACLDEENGGIWVHGGYRTYFPYLWTHGAGDLSGTSSSGKGGFIPYPNYPFFLDDLWFFNFSTQIWTQITPSTTTQPDARADHQMVKAGDQLVLFGGYADNYYFDDTWLFDTTTFTWLQKTSFVWPLFGDNCTDDLIYAEENNCTEFAWRRDLERDDSFPYEIKGYSEQSYYYPDEDYGPYFGILDKGQSFDEEKQLNSLYEGMPMGMYQGIAPRQWVKGWTYYYNGTHSAVVYERCTSVWGQPTRGKTVDGLDGRSDHHIFIAQPRRQAPGWDGCRDRAEDSDIDNELQWVHPGQRAEHRMVYRKKLVEGTEDSYEEMILMYGGIGYEEETVKTLSDSPYTAVLSEFWQLGIHDCPSNCSLHGECYYGFCFCDDGYYGVDCSNISCPGDYCYYDDENVQQCHHCCYAGYTHTDEDQYVSGLEKIPCSADVEGTSNGICDGFGTCQCAPPFIGEDCAIKDCMSNCSFNGWCSVEFPVSRCMCNPGYYGDICQYQECLNNCSYPNGVCNTTTGECACRMMYDPYNNTKEYYRWKGLDCSWIVAFADGHSLKASCLPFMLIFLLTFVFYILDFYIV